MDYFPATLYQKQMVQFWPVIDDKLRKGRKYQITEKNLTGCFKNFVFSLSGVLQQYVNWPAFKF